MRGSALVTVLLLLVPAAAFAGGSGSGIPETGGAGAGAASADARGLSANPAAAVGAGGTEATFDMAAMLLQMHYQRAPESGSDYGGSDSLNIAPVPYLAIRSDRLFDALSFQGRESYGFRDYGGRYRPGPHAPHANNLPYSRSHAGDDARLGVGLSLAPMFGRQVHLPGGDPGRYHLVSINYFSAYLTPSIAFRPVHGLRFGAGPVLGLNQITVRQHVDLAPSLGAMMGGTPPPAESSLLEGELVVKNARGLSYGWSVGGLYDVGDVATIGLSFIAPQTAKIHGRSDLTPSRDFSLYSTGNFTITQQLPPIVNLGTRVRPSSAPVEISLEGQWVGWSVNKTNTITITDSQLHSSNQTLNDLLNATGLTQSQLVGGVLDKNEKVARGWKDTWNALLGVEYRWSPMKTRFEVGYDKSAIPDSDVNPGNLDFDTVVLGAQSTYEPPDSNWSFGLAVSQYLNNGRNVHDSSFTSDAPVDSGYAFPTGNGSYGAVLTRIAVSTAVRF